MLEMLLKKHKRELDTSLQGSPSEGERRGRTQGAAMESAQN